MIISLESHVELDAPLAGFFLKTTPPISQIGILRRTILVPLEFCLTGLCFLIHSKQNSLVLLFLPIGHWSFSTLETNFLTPFLIPQLCLDTFPHSAHSSALFFFFPCRMWVFCDLICPCFVSEADKCPAFLSLACQFPQPLLVHRAFHAWRICLIVK